MDYFSMATEFFVVLLIISVFGLSIVAYQRFNNRTTNGREVAATTTNSKNDLLQIKRKKLQELRKLIHTRPDGSYSPETRIINVSEDLQAATIMTMGIAGGGAYGVGESYYNLNQAFSENEEFLSVMESRYNNVFENANRNTWLSKLAELNKHETIKANYISNYSGYKAELLGIEKLESLGFEVHQFEARNHPDNDLLAISPDGEAIEISVKNYENVNYLKRAVIDHPESKNYLINTDIYDKIQANPELKKWFADRDIELIDGEYTNAALRQTAQESIEAFSGMKESVSEELTDGALEGILDGVPLATLVLLGYKIKKNQNELQNGRQSLYENRVNMIGDSAGSVTKGLGAAGMAVAMTKLGGLAGVMFGPPGMVVGGAVGGTVGGILGAVGIGKFFESTKNKYKWGDINTAQLVVSTHYQNQMFDSRGRGWLINTILKFEYLEEQVEKLMLKLRSYEEELDEMNPKLPSLNAVIYEQQFHDLNLILKSKSQMLQRLLLMIEKEFTLWSEKLLEDNKVPKNQREFLLSRYKGEWVLQQTLSNDFPIDSSLLDTYNIYREKIKKSPNYPAKFSFEPVNNLKTLATTVQLECIDEIRLKKIH